jgi:anti-sigma regulatory factor (Ser/Thr protein kinase)
MPECRRYGQSNDGQVAPVEPFSVEAQVPGGPHAAARARHLVETELADRMPSEMLADVALLITELVANGVRHGGGGPDTLLRLWLKGGPPGLHVEVTNAKHGRAAVAPRPPDMTGGGGIGLHLVEALAARWGVRNVPSTAVWFEVDC